MRLALYVTHSARLSSTSSHLLKILATCLTSTLIKPSSLKKLKQPQQRQQQIIFNQILQRTPPIFDSYNCTSDSDVIICGIMIET